MGVCDFEMTRYRDAIVSFEKVTKKSEHHDRAQESLKGCYYHRGVFWFEMGNIVETKSDF